MKTHIDSVTVGTDDDDDDAKVCSSKIETCY